MHGYSRYDARAITVPEALVRAVRKRSVALGAPVLALSLVIGPALLIWPYRLVPYGDPGRIGSVIFGGIMGLSILGAGLFALLSRACIGRGQVNISGVRSIRVMLMFCWVLAILSGLLAWGNMALLLSTPPASSGRLSGLGVGGWLYVVVLFLGMGLTGACFFGVGKPLWRSGYVPLR